MSDQLHPWRQADQAYQLHHVSCAACKGAGLSPGRMERCADGAQLWKVYRETKAPPELTWPDDGDRYDYIP